MNKAFLGYFLAYRLRLPRNEIIWEILQNCNIKNV